MAALHKHRLTAYGRFSFTQNQGEIVKIRQQFAPLKHVSAGTNPARFITVHETANTSKGADAQAHANLQSRPNPRAASWHWQVDDKQAIQSFPHTVRCWHAGDGAGKGNFESIGIEICVNSDGNYTQAVANAAELVRKIMADENIPLANVVQHNHWSGKNCPTGLRKSDNWKRFLAQVAQTAAPIKPVAPKPAPKPKPSKPATALLTADGYWGSSTTRRLQEVLRTKIDGVVSAQAQIWRAQNPGLTTGWSWTSSKQPAGSLMIAALQRRLGVEADGLIGPATIKALQRHLGTPADGRLDKKSRAIIALQNRLNEGKI